MPKGVLIFPMLVLSFIFITGILNAVFPKFMWKMFESWKAVNEPTEAYFISRRIGGIFAVIVVIAMFLFPYIRSRH